MAADFVGLRPAMIVQEGDRVRLGQPLLADKSFPEVRHVAPGAGTIRGINRGPKRKLISIEIDWRVTSKSNLPRTTCVDWMVIRSARPCCSPVYGRPSEPGHSIAFPIPKPAHTPFS